MEVARKIFLYVCTNFHSKEKSCFFSSLAFGHFGVGDTSVISSFNSERGDGRNAIEHFDGHNDN